MRNSSHPAVRSARTPLLTAAMGAAWLGACGGGDEGPYTVEGSARLPQCSEPPAVNLDGTVWYDNGQLTIQTEGCGYDVGEVLEVCALQWAMSQDGNDVDILVDNEYRVSGRICGDQLHLQGGWWLPVVDENGQCTYRERDAAEVGIEKEGSTLTVADPQMTGTLVVREQCVAKYDVTFSLLHGRSSQPLDGSALD